MQITGHKSAIAIATGILASTSALAQDTLEVPVQAVIVDKSDLASISLIRDGDFGEVARPQNAEVGICQYTFTDDQSFMSDRSNRFVPGPGTTPLGCALLDDIVTPMLSLNCRAGIPVTLSIPQRAVNDALRFQVTSIEINGEWRQPSSVSGTTYTFDVACPSTGPTSTRFVGIQLGIEMLVFPSTDPGAVQTTIPVELLF